MRIRTFGFLSLALAAVLLPPHAHSHDAGGGVILGPPGHDKPGPPPLLTAVELTTIEHPDMDDGFIFGGDAEVSVSISVVHAGHGARAVAVVEDDLNFDETQGTWILNAEIYSHRECTPMEPITINVTGFEADATNLTELESILLELASTLAEKALLGIDAGVLADIVRSALATLNPDDSLGKGSTTVDAPGQASVTTAGGDYSITANFEVTAPAVAGTECDPDSIPPGFVDPPFCYFSIAYFDSLTHAYQLVDLVDIEPGNPANLTPEDLEDAKNCLRSLIVKMAQWEAAHLLEEAQGLAGFPSALFHYQSGLASSGISAIQDFRQAFCAAEWAIDNNVPDPFAPPMTPGSLAVPEMMATRSGRTIEYLVGTFGPAGSGIQSISGGPPGAVFTLRPADPLRPSWQTLEVAQSGPPGTYPIQVHFVDPQLAPLPLLLDIDDAGSVTDANDGHVEMTSPPAFALHPVVPNPVATTAFVRAALPRAAVVSLIVYDVAGRKVREILDGDERDAGEHTFAIDVHGLVPGVYALRMEAKPQDGAASFIETRKFVVTR